MEASEARAAVREQRETADKLRAWNFAVAAEQASKVASDKLSTPSKVDAVVRVGKSPLEARGWSEADSELHMMIVDGFSQLPKPQFIGVSDDVKNFYQKRVLDVRSAHVINDNGEYVRAMSSQESGFGLQLLGSFFSNEIWNGPDAGDDIVNLIREVNMPGASLTLPQAGALPEVILLPESTSPTQSPNPTVKTPSSSAVLTAQTLGANQIFSAQLEQDSLVALVPWLRSQLARSIAWHNGSAYFNGDATNTGATGNINLDDAQSDASKHYRAFNGIRLSAHTDSLRQDMAGALDFKAILAARAKLNGAVDDVDAGATQIDWSKPVSDLAIVCDPDTYYNVILNNSDTITLEKYGSQAVVATGEIARLYGLRVFVPNYCSKTAADGKANTTESDNSKGQIVVFNPRGFISGGRQDVSLYMSRLPLRNQVALEVTYRKAFVRFGAHVAAQVYNISL
jgi:HK97 family phage major capsid protein